MIIRKQTNKSQMMKFKYNKKLKYLLNNKYNERKYNERKYNKYETMIYLFEEPLPKCVPIEHSVY